MYIYIYVYIYMYICMYICMYIYIHIYIYIYIYIYINIYNYNYIKVKGITYNKKNYSVIASKRKGDVISVSPLQKHSPQYSSMKPSF